MSREAVQSRTVNLDGLLVRLTPDGSRIRVRVLKKEPLTEEDRTQLQILEHQLRYVGREVPPT